MFNTLFSCLCILNRNSAKLPMVFATLYLTFFTVVVLIMSIVKEWPIDLIVTG